MVAFVGPSDAGKTTLLARFYEPSKGRIIVDGLSLSAKRLHSRRRQIGLVSQGVFLFGRTLCENIAYGGLDTTDIDIAEAVAKSQLAAVIEDLPQKLNMVVGERGVMLSGGQNSA